MRAPSGSFQNRRALQGKALTTNSPFLRHRPTLRIVDIDAIPSLALDPPAPDSSVGFNHEREQIYIPTDMDDRCTLA